MTETGDPAERRVDDSKAGPDDAAPPPPPPPPPMDVTGPAVTPTDDAQSTSVPAPATPTAYSPPPGIVQSPEAGDQAPPRERPYQTQPQFTPGYQGRPLLQQDVYSTAPSQPSNPQQHPASYPGPAGPGVAAQPVPQGPAQPMPTVAYPLPVAVRPSAFGLAFKNLWQVQADIWSGKVAEAFARPVEAEQQAGKSPFNWLVPFVLNSLLIAAVAVGLVGRLASMLSGSIFDSMGIGLSSSDYFKVFFWAFFLAFAMYMLLSVANLLTHRISGSQASFGKVADSLAVANTALWLPLIALFLVIMVFPPRTAPVVALLLINGMALMVIVLSYVGVTRDGPHRRSPVVPFAWLTVAAWVVELVIVMVLADGALGY